MINNIFSKDFLIISSLFLLPVTLYLNSINLPQVYIIYFFYLILAQFLFFFLLIFLTFILYHFFFKKKISFINFVIVNSFFFFALFYYKNILVSVQFLNKYFFLLDNIVTFSIYTLFYLLTFLAIIKQEIKLKNFLVLFLIINFLLFTFDFIKITYSNNNILSQNIKSQNNNYLDLFNVKKNKINNDIFFIILDGMINLKEAKNKKIIKSDLYYQKILKDNNFKYLENFNSNYIATQLNLTTLLDSVFPYTENSKRYKNRSLLYPITLQENNTESNFIKILNKVSYDFAWIGNQHASCNSFSFGQCPGSDYFYYINKVIHLYQNSFMVYFFDIAERFNENNIQFYQFLNNIEHYNEIKKNNKRQTFFLIHAMSPHPPYIFNEDCGINTGNQEPDDTLKKKFLYSYAYKCIFDLTMKWSEEINKINEDSIIVILGDHGWDFRLNTDGLVKAPYFTPHQYEHDYSFYYNKLNNIFLSIKSPKKCKSLTPPRSHINVMRFVLNCNQNANLDYLDDKQFLSFSTGSKNFGLIQPFIKDHFIGK